MSNTKKTLTFATVALGSLLLLGGCSSSDKIDQALADAQKAMSAAQEAGSTAASADRKADQALAAASQAQATANEALSKANATDEKLSRMYKKSMSK